MSERDDKMNEGLRHSTARDVSFHKHIYKMPFRQIAVWVNVYISEVLRKNYKYIGKHILQNNTTNKQFQLFSGYSSDHFSIKIFCFRGLWVTESEILFVYQIYS